MVVQFSNEVIWLSLTLTVPQCIVKMKVGNCRAPSFRPRRSIPNDYDLFDSR
jgi:hypothetical protein